MKALLLSVLSIITINTGIWGQNSAQTKPAKLKSGAFSGNWKGDEKCTVVSAPGTALTVVTNGPNSVLVWGIYSSQGRLKGTLKDDIVTILPQLVNDPNFQNLVIDGNLTLSPDKQSLIGSFTIQNNETRDQCTATYHK